MMKRKQAVDHDILLNLTALSSPEGASGESDKARPDFVAFLEKQIEEKTLDLKKKNDALKKSEELYHRMVEEVEDYAIILLDENGIIQNWNKGAEKIKGYSEKEIIGKSFELFYSNEDRKKGLPGKLINEARKAGKAVVEGWRMRKDGKKFWGSIVITALHDGAGNVIGFSKVTRDLTERKQSETKLKEYSRELEFQNRELEEFAYATSHDLKEPLRKIHLYNSFVLDNSGNKLDDRSKEFMARSIGAVNRMSKLIEDLLTYSKNTFKVESFSNVDLNDVVNEILLLHKDELDAKNILIETSQLPVVTAIPFQCQQLLDNLINNSVKYTNPGRQGLICISSEVVKGYHKVSVIDNGVGFRPEFSDKIFEIFQRLDTSPGITGSGIGLSICKKIMQNHKGFIEASGQVNEGARFDMYFPQY